MSFEVAVQQLWQVQPLGPLFLGVGALAVATLVALRVRAMLVLRVDVSVLMVQIDKLVAANNVERAQRLVQAFDGPVSQLLRSGLALLQAPAGPEDKSRALRAALERAIPEVQAPLLRGVLPARILGGVCLALGGVLLAGPGREAGAVVGGAMGLVALLLVGTVTQQRRLEDNLAQVIDGLCNLAKAQELKQ